MGTIAPCGTCVIAARIMSVILLPGRPCWADLID